MRRLVFILLFLVAGTVARGQTNLLANSDFETNPPANWGDNINLSAISGWSVNLSNANIVQVDGGTHNYLNGPICDASVPCLQVPQHYFDGTAASTSIKQDFRTRCEGRVEVGGWFSTRADQQATGKIELLDGSTVIGSQSVNMPGGTSRTDPWTHVSFVVPVLASHTYTYRATLDDNANFDNAYVHYLTNCDASDCMTAETSRISCNGNGTFTITTIVTNHTGGPVQYVTVTPPPGATYTVTPPTTSVPIPNSGNASISVTISGATAGQNICLQYALQDVSGKTCCYVWRCYTAPECACISITKVTIGCDPGPDQYVLTFNLTNNTTHTIQQIVVIPSPGSVTTPVVATNIPPGATVPITLHLNGLTALQQLCLILQTMRDDATDCCTQRFCVTVPRIPIPCD